ncbi:MAG: hypothetical protein HYY30_10350 [Chloroflexi bacterium]|nr:hypothetical protein [Chloroflexota bacterium]
MATKTILIVVPDQDVGAVLAFALAEDGHEVSIVDSLRQAKEELSKSDFDLIITDAFNQVSVFLFNSAFINELKRVAGETPVILCSRSPSTYHIRPDHYGLAAVIPRPFLLDRLLANVNRVLREAPCA